VTPAGSGRVPPGGEEIDRGRAGRGLSTSIRGNSPAFGFSIMITASFGVASGVAGAPTAVEALLFGVGAAAAIALMEAAVSRGFRATAVAAPSEVRLLATSMNVASVTAAVGTAIAVAELLGGGVGWPAVGGAASAVYVFTEAAEVMLAELIQAARGDPDAGAEERSD
jgi:hypothetical protein